MPFLLKNANHHRSLNQVNLFTSRGSCLSIDGSSLIRGVTLKVGVALAISYNKPSVKFAHQLTLPFRNDGM